MGTMMLIALLLLTSVPASAQVGPLPFDAGWRLEGDGIRLVTDGSRQVLEIENGVAHQPDATFTDGTIDLEVQLGDRRSFVYVEFRIGTDGDREEFYLRPHKSNLPDAVQYAPVWQGRSAWQLYHGPGGTAAAGFTAGQWTPVRVIVRGRHAAIFIGDMTAPALLVPRLARDPQAGHIAVRGFIPAGTSGTAPAARFANVRVSREVAFDFEAALQAAEEAAPVDGLVIRSWSVSRAFVPEPYGADLPAVPAGAATSSFTQLETEPGGLLALHRYVKVAPNSRTTAAVAKTTVRAARAGVYPLDLGFSDIATVFVNGAPVFTGDASYAFDRPRREGLIGYDQARLYLPLKEGDNELAVLVSDAFGGWGLMARFGAATGLTLAAAR